MDIRAKVVTKVRIAMAEARAPKVCLRAKDQAKASKADPLRPRAPQSYSYRRRLRAPPLHSQQMPQTSLAASVTRKVITSPNALNGWRFDHPPRTSKKAASTTPWHDF